jgi:hypothetical protein
MHQAAQPSRHVGPSTQPLADRAIDDFHAPPLPAPTAPFSIEGEPTQGVLEALAATRGYLELPDGAQRVRELLAREPATLRAMYEVLHVSGRLTTPDGDRVPVPTHSASSGPLQLPHGYKSWLVPRGQGMPTA